MHKKTVTAVLATFALFITGDVYGFSQLGYGGTSCGIFNSIAKDGGAMVESIDSWTLGFLSGLNQAAMTAGKPDQLRNHQPARIAAYIRSHCKSNPTQTVAKAVSTYWSNTIEE